jgi:hypothetical protein
MLEDVIGVYLFAVTPREGFSQVVDRIHTLTLLEVHIQKPCQGFLATA